MTAPDWTAVRTARPVRDLARATSFYRDLLGLAERGGFTGHDGYDGVFLALPGGAELELTRGPVEPGAGTDDLLVLYLPTPERVAAAAARLGAAGVAAVRSADPYWERWGRTFLDPDGHHVVLAAVDVPEVQVRLHEGSRRSLRPHFELAEDSSAQLDSYIDAGRVLVAGTGADTAVGHLQLVSTDEDGTSELKNMAVRQDLQGRGVGGRLVAAAIELLAAEGTTRLVVATAAAGTGDLRFYQRQGFRLLSVERDAFTEATGYPAGTLVDGIELRDRVWLDRRIEAGRASPEVSDLRPA
jgi:ribosomal protein S18 acetylase RimI-like enzyme